MKIINCPKCKKKSRIDHLSSEKGGYQYQYEECSSCGYQVLVRKEKIPPNWDRKRGFERRYF